MRNREELEQAWRTHRRWVTAVLLAHRPPGADLEDLLQDVALVLVRRGTEVRDPRAVRPWLRKIARNVAADAARRRGVRERTRGRPVDWAELADPGCSPAAGRSDAADQVERTLSAVGGLPVELREALLLRSVDGLTQRAIAEILEVPETTVETRLARARRLLRERLSNAKGAGRWTTSLKRSS